MFGSLGIYYEWPPSRNDKNQLRIEMQNRGDCASAITSIEVLDLILHCT